MKILMISGDKSLAAGKRGAFYYMLEEFHKYWERVDIIVPKFKLFQIIPNQSQNLNTKSQKVFDNVYVHASNSGVLKQPWFIKNKGVELYNEYKHNIVLIHEYPPFYNSLGARLLKKKIDSKFVVEIHHIIGHPKQAGWKERFYFWLSKKIIPKDCKRFDAVRVVNKKQVPELLNSWSVEKEKIHYASSMYIDLDVFRPIDLHKKYDIVFAGRLAKNKNVGMLIEAVKILKDKGKDLKCVIIGEGPERENFQFSIFNFQLQDNIKMVGWLPGANDVAKIYNQSKIFVMPSLNEGGPRVCLEAMACGVPVVTTRVGVMLDIIRDGENGVFCEWRAEDMADKILEIEKLSPAARGISAPLRKLRDEVRRTAKQFERKKMIRNLAERYKRIVNN